MPIREQSARSSLAPPRRAQQGSQLHARVALARGDNRPDRRRSGPSASRGIIGVGAADRGCILEVLRRHFCGRKRRRQNGSRRVRDPALGRCLALIHADARHEWSLAVLAKASGLSRSALSERFGVVIGISPIRYMRYWPVFRQRRAEDGRATNRGDRLRCRLWVGSGL